MPLRAAVIAAAAEPVVEAGTLVPLEKFAGVTFVERYFTRKGMANVTIPELRALPRMPMAFPAKLACVYGTLECELLDLSGVGALVRSASPLSLGASTYLRAGPCEIFAVAVRKDSNQEAPALTGVMFDDRLTRDQIASLRIYARDWIRIEQRREYVAARDWWNAGIGQGEIGMARQTKITRG
ncbi:PilZ domain-containing protein [Porphyrobacter sp. AAP82]|uniref:PilZ domain-containing protein n=1 Tax=Porphyrobacter sp. AAP82 TaxID=1248917 RepID=UPI00036BA6E0|nr:PilZ domain-containing protein [Porphyrobacter sp. AAP82]